MSLKRPHSSMEDVGSYAVTSEVKPSVIQAHLPKLRLRQHTHSITQKLTIDIHEAKTTTEKLRNLVNFSNQLRLSSIASDEVEHLIRLLKDVLKKETEPALRAKAVQLYAEVSKIPGVSKVQVAEEILESLHKETNHTVVSQIFKSLAVTSSLLSIKADVLQKMVKAAVKRLEDTHQDVRCACLSLISQVCPREAVKVSKERSVDVLELLTDFSVDQDPRVRAVVYQSFLALHQRGHKLDLEVYMKASSALSDDYENVRLAAVRLVWVVSHILPEKIVPRSCNRGESMRLIDDAFIKICNMVNDSCMHVRADAVRLLGSMHNVSFSILEQTLDKKLMSRGQKVKSVHERQQEHFRGDDGGGSWSSGNTWGDNGPSQQGAMDEDEVKLMNSGACGVFVRGLEDEFMEVRAAGVDSMCELSDQNPAFARMSTDFLVDMFNDEIESIRLNSITSLIKIHASVDLREDQLDTILNVLSDFNWEIRASVRNLLAHCTLSTQACLHATVLALLSNLKKYPHDRESIWRCLKDLGVRHPYFVSSLVAHLMVTHTYFAVPEPNIDDPGYIAVAILIFNAACKCPPIHSLLPDYAKQHYDYLCDSLPHLVPKSRHANLASANASGCEYDAVSDFYNATVKRACSCDGKSTSAIARLVRSCITDFKHVKSLHGAFKPASEFLVLFLECLEMIMKSRDDRAWSVPGALATDECGPLHSVVLELLSRSYKMEFLFTGLTCGELNAVKMVRILAHTLQLLLQLRSMARLRQARRVDLKMWDPYLTRLQKFRAHLISTSSGSEHLDKVSSLESSVEENLSSVASLVGLVQDFFLTCPVKPLKVTNQLRQASAEIREPRGNSDNPLRFCAGLTLGVNVEAVLTNVERLDNVYVKIVYPDQEVQLYKPKTRELHCTSTWNHQLVCTVLLSHRVWTEPCHVKVSLVLMHPTDVREELTSPASQTADKCSRSSEQYSNSFRGYLELSDVVNVYVQPKAISR